MGNADGSAILGEVRAFTGSLYSIPSGWVLCNGATYAIAQYQALYSLLGQRYATASIDQSRYFMIPDFRSRAPVGIGLSPVDGQYYDQGTRSGTATTALMISNLPSHSHTLNASVANATSASPNNTVIAAGADGALPFRRDSVNATVYANSVAPSGGSTAHNNLQPYLTTYFIIAITGLYPSRP